MRARVLESLEAAGWVARTSPVPPGSLDVEAFLEYVRSSQPEGLAEARRRYPSTDVEEALVESLRETLAAPRPRGGTVGVFGKPVLRYGIAVRGEGTDLATLRADVACGSSVADFVLYLNGMPVAALFLSERFAEAETRLRAGGGILGRSGSVLNFASDGIQVSLAPSPAGERTAFTPFNRQGDTDDLAPGSADFLWEELLTPDGVADILGDYAFEVPGRDGRGRVYLPRYHQLDAVRSIFADVRGRSFEGNSYLVQASAGSGKSNTIAWLAGKLAYEKDDAGNWAFDRVLVISDRRVIDSQLAESVREHANRGGRSDVASPRDSQELTAALFGRRNADPDHANPPRMVVSTVQKFPFVEAFGEMANSGHRYAVLIDEAHSSQSGSNAYALADRLSGDEDWDLPEDIDQEALDAIKRLGPKPKNLTFVAFTATPRKETLVQFGVQTGEGEKAEFRPFHLYSMRQAIREGYILDVLEDYTPYWLLYRLADTGQGMVEGISAKRLASLLRAKASREPETMRYKASIMLEHYVSKVRPECGNAGKAMIVAESRAAVVEYSHILAELIAESPEEYGGLRTMVAFSGTLVDALTGEETSEAFLNGVPEAKTKSEFRRRGDLLLVCDKFQTGFDEPLLCGMYVDKSLDGLKIVQTLSRLNRIHPDWEKRTHILDFKNSPGKIRGEFAKYYDVAEVDYDAEGSLEDLGELFEAVRGWGLFEDVDVESLWTASQSSPTDYAAVEASLAGGTRLFGRLEDEARIAFLTDARNAQRTYNLARLLFTIPDLALHQEAFYLTEMLRRVSAGRVRNYFDIEAEVEAVMAEQMRASKAGPSEFKDQKTTRPSKSREDSEEQADVSAIIEIINIEDGGGLLGQDPEEQALFADLRDWASGEAFSGLRSPEFVSSPEVRTRAAAFYERVGQLRGYVETGDYVEYDRTSGLSTSFESYFLGEPEDRELILTAFLEALYPLSAGKAAAEERRRLRSAVREGQLLGVLLTYRDPVYVRRVGPALYVVDAEGYRVAVMSDVELAAMAADGTFVPTRRPKEGERP